MIFNINFHIDLYV